MPFVSMYDTTRVTHSKIYNNIMMCNFHLTGLLELVFDFYISLQFSGQLQKE